MYDAWESKWSDDFYLDGSAYSEADLDFTDVEFLGGALDGNVISLGLTIVPSEITQLLKMLAQVGVRFSDIILPAQTTSRVTDLPRRPITNRWLSLVDHTSL
jgi:hypothetical protein